MGLVGEVWQGVLMGDVGLAAGECGAAVDGDDAVVPALVGRGGEVGVHFVGDFEDDESVGRGWGHCACS